MGKNYTIAEYTSLPSKGKVYGKEMVAPTVQLSSMTTRHEMQRLSPSESSSKAMSAILDDCLVEDIGIPAYDLCSGDYQFLMYKLREVTYGKDIKLSVVCPHCLTQQDLTVDLDQLEIKEYTPDVEKLREFTLPKSGKTIKLKFQTPHMLDRVADQVKERRERTSSQEDYSLVFLLKEMIETVDGDKPNPLSIESWLENLPMMDTNTIVQKATKLDSMIGVDNTLDLICDHCGKDFKSEFRVTQEFFRPEADT